MSDLTPVYDHGTRRLATPEQTLERIKPLLTRCGITRCADVTMLDDLGVPVYCAIRPGAAVLQVANGKGLDRASAMVSGLMEAVELFHAENPLPRRTSRASARALREQGREFLSPQLLSGFDDGRYYSDTMLLDWVQGEDLATGRSIHVPAGCIYFHMEPSVHLTTTNGLASGNHIVEATLHALYEVIERDATDRLLGDGPIRILERCRILDSAGLPDELSRLVLGMVRSGSRLVVLHVPSCVPVHTFWAVLLNDRSAVSGSTFNTGWGTHSDPLIAAVRAVTEAAQSRATMIQGSREDALLRPVMSSGADARKTHAFTMFDRLEPDTSWSDLPQGEGSGLGLNQELRVLVGWLQQAGHAPVVRCDLTHPGIGIPVVKVVAPTLRFRYR